MTELTLPQGSTIGRQAVPGTVGSRRHEAPGSSSRQVGAETPVQDAFIPARATAQDAPGMQGPRSIPLTIVYTNDLHGQVLPFQDRNRAVPEVGGLARIASRIHEVKAQAPGGVLLLDAGDISTGSIVSDMFNAEPMVRVMNALHYDGMAIGNHEFDRGAASLHTLLSEAEFPVLAANLVDRAQMRPIPSQRYVIQDVNGLKVGILGLTTTQSRRQLSKEDQERIVFLDAVATAREAIPQMRAEGADLVVALTHLGVDEDRHLAQAVPGIDVIVGGHSHTTIPGYEKVDDTIIVQSGSYGRNLGEMQLGVTRDAQGARVSSVEAHLTPITSALPDDPEVAAIIKTYTDQLQAVLGKVVGQAGVDLRVGDHHSPILESNLPDFAADTFRAGTGADVVAIPLSVFRGDIPAGEVKMDDLYRAYPLDEGMSKVDMTGEALLRALESCLTDAGDGFRIAVSGLRFSFDPARPVGQRITSVTLADGQPLDKTRTYSVVERNFMLDAPGKFDAFKKCTNRSAITVASQDMLARRFEQESPITQQVDGRVARASC